jgi:hypothetical protein
MERGRSARILRRKGRDRQGKGSNVQNIVQIARGSWIIMLAALGIVIGAGMVAYSAFSGPPARESLQVVEGTITQASRVTRKNRRTGSITSYFEMTLKPANLKEDLKLRVPTIEMAESDLRSIINRPVRAEFDSEKDVYVLSSNNREVLTYKDSLERRHLNFRQYHVDGIALMIASAVALLIGFILGYRKHRRAASALAAQAQE